MGTLASAYAVVPISIQICTRVSIKIYRFISKRFVLIVQIFYFQSLYRASMRCRSNFLFIL